MIVSIIRNAALKSPVKSSASVGLRVLSNLIIQAVISIYDVLVYFMFHLKSAENYYIFP